MRPRTVVAAKPEIHSRMLATKLLLLLASLAPVSAFVAAGPAAPLVLQRPGAMAVSAAPVVHSACRAAAIAMKEKKDVLELEGTVLEALKGANFRVQIDDTDQVILAHVSGKIRKNFIKILVGDSVTCELSPYDLTKGRITFRRR